MRKYRVTGVAVIVVSCVITVCWWTVSNPASNVKPGDDNAHQTRSVDEADTPRIGHEDAESAHEHGSKQDNVAEGEASGSERKPERVASFNHRLYPFLGQRSFSRDEQIALQGYASNSLFLDADEFRKDNILIVTFENGEDLSENTKREIAAAHYAERAEYYSLMDQLFRDGEGHEFDSSESANSYTRRNLSVGRTFIMRRAGNSQGMVALDRSKITEDPEYQSLLSSRDQLTATLEDTVSVHVSLQSRGYLVKSVGQ